MSSPRHPPIIAVKSVAEVGKEAAVRRAVTAASTACLRFHRRVAARIAAPARKVHRASINRMKLSEILNSDCLTGYFLFSTAISLASVGEILQDLQLSAYEEQFKQLGVIEIEDIKLLEDADWAVWNRIDDVSMLILSRN